MATLQGIEIPDFNSYEEFKAWYLSQAPGFESANNYEEVIKKLWNFYVAENEAKSSGDYTALLGTVAENGGTMSPEKEKWLDDMIANQRTEEARNYDTNMRDTSLLSSAEQLKQLGLSTSNVITTGGASNNGVAAANQNMHSAASLRQQQKLNEYNQKMGLAKTLISTAGSMASSGIYGSAIGAVKNTASKVAGSAAHSGLNALKSLEKDDGSWLKNFEEKHGTITQDMATGYLIPEGF